MFSHWPYLKNKPKVLQKTDSREIEFIWISYILKSCGKPVINYFAGTFPRKNLIKHSKNFTRQKICKYLTWTFQVFLQSWYAKGLSKKYTHNIHIYIYIYIYIYLFIYIHDTYYVSLLTGEIMVSKNWFVETIR